MRCFILLLFIFLSTGCVNKLNVESLLFLEDLSAGSDPSRLKKKTTQPKRTAINFTVDGRSYSGDLYQPVKPTALAKIVLVPGMTPQGKDDIRLINFAYTLARSRFQVLVPDIPNLRALKVKPSDSLAIADAFKYLITSDHFLPHARAGIGAFSYAVGPTILAAMQPDIRNKVDYLISVGGYYDLNQVLTFFTTGYHQLDGKWQYLAPNEYGKWVFISSNLSHIKNTGDREAFSLMAKRKLQDENASIDDLATSLGAEGWELYTFLNNAYPEQTASLIDNLSASLREELDSLNIAKKDLTKLKANVILIHGRDDNIIPYSESIALAKRLPSEQVQLFAVTGLSHVDVKPGLLDKWRMLKAASAILRQREKK